MDTLVHFSGRRFSGRLLAGVLALLLASEPTLAALATPARPAPVTPLRLIQDIHAHPEAQRSVADLLRRLGREKGRAIRVGVEGAAGDFDFAPYRAFPDAGIRRRVADELVDENRIAGPVLAALDAEEISLVGIEDAELYRANVAAYLRSRAARERLLTHVASEKAELARRKAAVFSPELARFDAAVTAYRNGDVSLGDHLAVLVDAAGDAGLASESFLAAYRMERSIDFKRVEAERRRFVERLVAALGAGETAELRRWTEGLSDDVGAARRFDYLFRVAQSRSVDLSAFPALTDYVRYLKLSESIDIERLFAEAAEAEAVGYRRFCGKDAAAAAIVTAARRLHLTEKLIKFELTHEDWRAYLSLRAAGGAFSDEDLAPFEDFYRIAAQRDRALASLALAGKLDAIVVGGFHTEGLRAALKEAGIPIEIARPKISGALPGDATAYLNAFAAKRTPLDRLFSRFRLFLAPPHVMGVREPLVESTAGDVDSRYVMKFRRMAASKPALGPAIDRAADNLERREKPRGDLRWLTETLTLSVLAAGLATGIDGLVVAGVFLHLLGLPLIHLPIDIDAPSTVRRQEQRLVWSGLFLAAYLVPVALMTAIGVPMNVSAVLSLLSPAGLHWLNHVAYRDRGSLAAFLLFDFLRLPAVLMSTAGKSEADELEAADAKSEISAAIAEWRASPDPLGRNVANDPVVLALGRIEDRIAGRDIQAAAPVLAGIIAAFASAGLTYAEIESRIFRDVTAAGLKGLDITEAGPSHLTHTFFISRIFRFVSALPGDAARLTDVSAVIRELRADSGSGGLLNPSVTPTFDRARVDANLETMRRATIEAVAGWRTYRGDDLMSGGNRGTFILSRADLYSRGNGLRDRMIATIAEALASTEMTPAEITARVRMDTRDSARVQKKLDSPVFEALVYLQLTNIYQTRKDPERQAAVLEGINLAIRDAAEREFAESIRAWRDNAADPKDREFNKLIIFAREVFHEQNREGERLMPVLDGVAAAHVSSAVTGEELTILIYGLMMFAVGFDLSKKSASNNLVEAVSEIYRRLGVLSPDLVDQIAAARGSGTFAGVRPVAEDAIERLRGDGAPNVNEFQPLIAGVRRLVEGNGLPVEELVSGVVAGIVNQDPTGEEATEIITQLMAPLVTTEPSEENLQNLRLASQIAIGLSVTLIGDAKTSADLAIDSLLNPADPLRRELEIWKAAPDVPRGWINIIWKSLRTVRTFTEGRGSTTDDIVRAIVEADLPTDLLNKRVKLDLGRAIKDYGARKLTEEELVWESRVGDSTIDNILDAYLQVAREYREAGDEARALAILEAATGAFGEAISAGDVRGSVLLHKVSLPLQRIGETSLDLKFPELAQIVADLVLQVVSPLASMPEIVRDTYDLLGRSLVQTGEVAGAIERSFEYVPAMLYHEVSGAVVPVERWAVLMDRTYNAALTFHRLGGYSTALLYAEWAVAKLEAEPAIRAALAPGLERRLRALRAAARAITSRDRVALRQNTEEFDELVLPILSEPELTKSERDAFLMMSLVVFVIAARTGDRTFAERARSLADLTFDDSPSLAVSHKSEVWGALAHAHPAERDEFDRRSLAEFTRPRPAIETLLDSNEVLYAMAFATNDATFGRLEEAETFLRAIDERLKTPEFRAANGIVEGAPRDVAQRERRRTTEQAVARLRIIVLTELASVMTKRGAPHEAVVSVLSEAFTLKGFDTRLFPDIHQFVGPFSVDRDRFMEAIHLLIMAPERGGVSIEARVRAAEWARAFDPAGTQARREAWTKATKFKKAGAAIAERFALRDSVGPNEWPGELIVRLEHANKLAYYPDYADFVASLVTLKGQMGAQDFARRFDGASHMLRVYAGALTAMGMAREAVEVLRLSRQLATNGVQTFLKGGAIRSADDVGLINLPYVAGDYLLLLEQANLELKGDAERARIVLPMVMTAISGLAGVGFSTEREFAKALELAEKLVIRVYQSQNPIAAAYALARIYLWRGNLPQAISSAVKAGSVGGDSSPYAPVFRVRSRTFLGSLVIRDPERTISNRLEMLSGLLDVVEGDPNNNVTYVAQFRLLLALFRYNPAEPGAAAGLVRLAIDGYRRSIEANGLGPVLESGFPMRLAEAALLAGPAVNGEILEVLAAESDLIGLNLRTLAVSREMSRLFSSDPVAFLAWMDANTDDAVSEFVALRMTAAHRTGNADRALKEAVSLISAGASSRNESYAILYAAEVLMELPIARTAFLEIVKSAMSSYTPAAWTGNPEGLLKLVDLATYLGDPEIIYVADALAENKSFPYREKLLKITSRLEPVLGFEEWGERVARMSEVNPARVKTIRSAAERKAGAELDRMRDILDQRLETHGLRETAKVTIAAAVAEYKDLFIAQAIEKIRGIPEAVWPTGTRATLERMERMQAIWVRYQSGDTAGALAELATAGDEDAVPTVMRKRIEAILLAESLLGDGRLEEAGLTLRARNGIVDVQQAAIEAKVRDRAARARTSYDLLKRSLAALSRTGSPSDMEGAMVETLRLDSEYQEAMRYIIAHAEELYLRGEKEPEYLGYAEDVLLAFRKASRIFNPEFPAYAKFEDLRQKWEQVRSLVRARGMRTVIEREWRMYRTIMQAIEHKILRSAPVDLHEQTVENQIFHPGEWIVTASGMEMKTVQREKIETKRRRDEPAALEPVDLGSTNFFQSNLSFMISSADGKLRVPLNVSRRDGGRGIIFTADAAGVETLRLIATNKKGVRMVFLKDIAIGVMASAMERSLNMIDRHIDIVSGGRTPASGNPIVTRLLGLDVSAQPFEELPETPFIQDHFRAQPTQLAAITAAVHPKNVLTAIQGPPGTGKSTTATEIIRLLTTPVGAQQPGRIVVVTAQAHAGVDTMAEKLDDAGISIVRSASTRAQETNKVAKRFQMEEKARLDALFKAIETHHSSGVGFAYLATNSGLHGDRKVFELLNLYLSGAPMVDVRLRHAQLIRPGVSIDPRTLRRDSASEVKRQPIKVVLAQEEAGQAGMADTLVPLWAFASDKAITFGDQLQLSPHGVDDEKVAIVREAVADGMVSAYGKIEDLFSDDNIARTRMSPFERAYEYSQAWGLPGQEEGGGFGVTTRFLDVARRSHWVITDAIVNLFYGRLRHRQASEPVDSWERIQPDTVMFVNTNGRQTVPAAISEGPETTGGRKASPRKEANYTEVGEVLRAVLFHLNGGSDGSRPREPGEILILTPYSAQNEQINLALRWLATFSDAARGDTIAAADMARNREVLVAQLRAAGASGSIIPQVEAAIRGLSGGDRRNAFKTLLKVISPYIDAQFDGRRQLSLSDLPKPKKKPTDGTVSGEDSPDEESLDEQRANLIEAKTVHSVQGQERAVVIVSLVRSESLGFLDQRSGREIINVGFSRVRDNLVVISSRGMVPDTVKAMIPRLRAAFAIQGLTFNDKMVSFPHNRGEMASLRAAWAVSTGSRTLDRFLDRWAMPVLETVLFLALLGFGLANADALMVSAGVLVKTVVFPALHALPGWLGLAPASEAAGELVAISARWTGLYIAVFALLTFFTVAPMPSIFLSMIPVMILHLRHNQTVSADLGTTEAAPLGLDQVDGLEQERPARIADEIAPPAPRAPSHRAPDSRAVLQGA